MDRPFTLSEGVDSWNTIIFSLIQYKSKSKDLHLSKSLAQIIISLYPYINILKFDYQPSQMQKS